MSKGKKLAVIAMAICLPGMSFAESTIEKITAINESIAITQARLQELELRLKVATKEGELERLGAPPTTNMMVDEIPTVRSIEGVGNNLKATLSLRGGITQIVGIGEKFSGWHVTQISSGAVTVTRGKDVYRLGFAHEPPPASSSGVAGIQLPPPAPRAF